MDELLETNIKWEHPELEKRSKLEKKGNTNPNNRKVDHESGKKGNIWKCNSYTRPISGIE